MTNARNLRTVAPAINVTTRRVRLTVAPLAVHDAAPPIGDTVTTPAAASDIARAVIGSEISECVLAIFLDARNRVTGYSEVARGTLNATCPACGGTIQATVDVDMTLTANGWEIAPTGGGYRLYCEHDCDDADFDEIETPDVYRLTYDPVTEDVPDCLHCGFPVFDGSGAVVRCEVCGPFCCEDHHRRHPSYAHHDIVPDECRQGSGVRRAPTRNLCTTNGSGQSGTAWPHAAPARCVWQCTRDTPAMTNPASRSTTSRAREDARNARSSVMTPRSGTVDRPRVPQSGNHTML